MFAYTCMYIRYFSPVSWKTNMHLKSLDMSETKRPRCIFKTLTHWMAKFHIAYWALLKSQPIQPMTRQRINKWVMKLSFKRLIWCSIHHFNETHEPPHSIFRGNIFKYLRYAPHGSHVKRYIWSFLWVFVICALFSICVQYNVKLNRNISQIESIC